MCFSDWLHSCVDFSEGNISVVKNMEAFERQDCQAAILRENSTIYLYCCDPFYDASFTIPSLPFLRLHGVFCHFSFINSPSERRNCFMPNSEALISKLDGLKSPCIINVKTSAIFQVGIYIIHIFLVVLLRFDLYLQYLSNVRGQTRCFYAHL